MLRNSNLIFGFDDGKFDVYAASMRMNDSWTIFCYAVAFSGFLRLVDDLVIGNLWSSVVDSSDVGVRNVVDFNVIGFLNSLWISSEVHV